MNASPKPKQDGTGQIPGIGWRSPFGVFGMVLVLLVMSGSSRASPPSVSPELLAEGFQAPGVVVSYTDDGDIHTGRKFQEIGIQIAAGVPLQCDEPEDFQTSP